MGYFIVGLIIVLVVIVGAVLIYRNNQKKAEALAAEIKSKIEEIKK
jgi:septation ring formation regulator EzrA